MIKRAQRLGPVRGFGIDRVAAAADAPKASERWPVLRMENLDTNLPLPPEAVRVTADSLERPESNSWLPFTGDLDLRAAISDFTAERTGHRYDPEREIVITVGGMEGLLNSLLATVDPGDEVIVTDPTYAGIVNRVHLVGATPKLVPFVVEDGGWRLDQDALRAAVTDRTSAMLLMSPSMPSGGTFAEEDWALACELCRDRDLLLIYDAAMERLLFDGRSLLHPLRFEGMAERTLVVGSLSKEHRMIGWRVGWVAGPARDDRGHRLGAHLQHDLPGLDRAPRGDCCPARGSGARGRVRRGARAPARRHARGIAGLAVRLTGRRLVAPPGRGVDGLRRAGGVRGCCSRRARSPRRQWSAGAARSPSATSASSSAPSRWSGSGRCPNAWPRARWDALSLQDEEAELALEGAAVPTTDRRRRAVEQLRCHVNRVCPRGQGLDEGHAPVPETICS